MDELSKAIGATRLIKLEKLSAETGASVYVKYEAANPGASIKDRAALSMIDYAEGRGDIAPGKTVLVEPTSGNTGIAVAMIGAARGYKVVLTMPESMSRERRALLAAYGAKLVLTPGAEGMAGAVARADAIVSENPDAWLVGQFSNPDNPRAHEEHTAPEIERALGCAPDFVVAGVGTGGTISGIAHYFAKRCRAEGKPPRAFAVEPAESPLIAQARAGDALKPAPHGIQGIGANFIPETLDLAALDGVLAVSTEEAIDQARWLASKEGLLVGISSGANIAGVRRLVRDHPEALGATVVTIAVDTGERYISTSLFEGVG
ncbi:cysteine synthase A [Raoultibacter phocaeensis]|uniref:cysteine synthase A n=1 Tax=Raoultibacter phocaeensis TaxID=2479841 RepID=UPI001118041A|nr:cysteine synthase A [Raoultibacter phocaeensis]